MPTNVIAQAAMAGLGLGTNRVFQLNALAPPKNPGHCETDSCVCRSEGEYKGNKVIPQEYADQKLLR